MKYLIADISKCNGSINANVLKDSVDGVIIRIGYRGYGKSGNIVPDLMFDNYAKACVEAKIPQIAFYFFPTSVNEKEAIEEAEYAYKMATKYVNNPLIYADSEIADVTNKNGRSDHLSKELRTKCLVAFCNRLIELGARAGVYASDSWFKNNLDISKLMGYSLWVAKYSTTSPVYVTAYDGWQYTSKAKINGIAKVANDMSIFSKNLNDISNSITEVKSLYPEPSRVLKKTIPCMRGEDVKWVQERLISKGYLPSINAKGKSNLDGIYGNDSKDAVIKFQKDVFPYDSKQWDGKVGNYTVSKLI